MPKEIEFTLPSGKKIRMRESTGLDQLAAKRRFIGKGDDEKANTPWEEIANCIIEIEGMKSVKGYEQLLQLTNKDLVALLFAYNQFNTPTEEEMKDLKSFFVPGKTSEPSPGQPVSA
ncbi:MAG: hypothetical protein WBB37_07600 [bacterium]